MTRTFSAATLSLCLALGLAGAAGAQTATRTFDVTGGHFSGTLGGSLSANVKLLSSDGAQLTFGVLSVTDLDVVTISDGGLGNLFPESVSLDNQGAALIAIAPTTIGVTIPATPFNQPVGGSFGVTAGDQRADAANGVIDAGVQGSDGAWDDPGKSGILNDARLEGLNISVSGDVNAPAVGGGLVAAVFPGDVTIPNVVNTSNLDIDLVIKQSSVVAVDFNNVHNLSLKNLSLSTSQPVALASPQENFDESSHPSGTPQLDLSAAGLGLVETTVSGTLVADLVGTVFASVDMRANIDVLNLVQFPVDFDDAVNGVISSGNLISINEPLNVSGAELPFVVSVLHEPTVDLDFDDVFAALGSGTLGLTVPFSYVQQDMILQLPPATFEYFDLLYRVDEGFIAQGWVWIPHFSGALGGQFVVDLAANFEVSAELLATAYEANAINVVPEPGTMTLAGTAALVLAAAVAGRRMGASRRAARS